MVAIVFSIGCSFAYFTARATSKGNFEFANLTIQAVTADDQVYTSQVFNNRINTKFKPGDNYTIKDIYVKNSGDCEVYALLELCLSFIKESDTSVSYTKTYWYNLAGTELTGNIAQTTVEATLVGVGEKVVSTFNLIIPEELDNTYKNATAKISIKIHAIQALLQAENGLSIAVTASRMIYNNKSTPVNTAFYKRIDANGNLDANGDYILFGSYPQTIKSADVTIDESDVDSNGYYLGSDGERYCKLKANPNYDKYKFSDSTSIVKDQYYYFKIEPIKWRILSIKNGEALLFSDYVIDASRWDNTNTLNYSTSTIRDFINNKFYEKAFCNEEQDIVKLSLVDNGKGTTETKKDDYVCEDTYDKVFLLSFADLINTQYGFLANPYSVDSARMKNASDYARANYLQSNELPDSNPNSAWYFLRSPVYTSHACASMSHFEGRMSDGGITASLGVAPAVTILL